MKRPRGRLAGGAGGRWCGDQRSAGFRGNPLPREAELDPPRPRCPGKQGSEERRHGRQSRAPPKEGTTQPSRASADPAKPPPPCAGPPPGPAAPPRSAPGARPSAERPPGSDGSRRCPAACDSSESGGRRAREGGTGRRRGAGTAARPGTRPLGRSRGQGFSPVARRWVEMPAPGGTPGAARPRGPRMRLPGAGSLRGEAVSAEAGPLQCLSCWDGAPRNPEHRRAWGRDACLSALLALCRDRGERLS